MEHQRLASPLTRNKEPLALVILEEGLGDQGKQLHMNIGIQGNLPPVFFK